MAPGSQNKQCTLATLLAADEEGSAIEGCLHLAFGKMTVTQSLSAKAGGSINAVHRLTEW